MLSDRIIDLARRYLAGNATEDEKDELHQWYDNWQDEEERIETDDNGNEIAERIKKRIFEIIVQKNAKTTLIGGPSRDRSIYWNRMLVAASVTFILGLLSYFVFFNPHHKMEKGATPQFVNDIKAPSISKATITLADGTSVPLDSLLTGIIARSDGVDITKTSDGKIIYMGNSEKPLLNVLYNPKASKVVNLVLADGTKVWLNNESSIKYPMAFSGDSREVEITGEAYFEVKKIPGNKFFVKSDKVTTEVLGTHFNVNVYSDLGISRVTLLEGSVKVSNTLDAQVIKPGQEARVGNSINVLNNVDLNRVVAWKDGFLNFKGENLQTIMKSVERLYDLEIVFTDNQPNRTFTGVVSRDVNLSELLKIFEASNIHFKLIGKKLTVIP